MYFGCRGSRSPGWNSIRNMAAKQPSVIAPASTMMTMFPQNGPMKGCCIMMASLSSSADLLDLTRAHGATVIAPGAALIVDQIGHVLVGQLRTEGRHHTRIRHTADRNSMSAV